MFHRPLYLLSDSELLFRKDVNGWTIPAIIRDDRRPDAPTAAYIGASNGDDPAFYQLFVDAMGDAGITRVVMIPSAPAAADLDALHGADVILLAGGDVRRGWDVMTGTGMDEIITRRHQRGATLIGVSAGAVQLGRLGYDDAGTFATLRLAPFIVAAHDEASDWSGLRRAVRLTTETLAIGLGIPHGGGLIVHTNGSLEPLRHPLIRMIRRETRPVKTDALPPRPSRYAT